MSIDNTGYDPENVIQKEGELSKNFKEVQQYFKENSGPEMAFEEEQVEDENMSKNYNNEVRKYFKENGGPKMAHREDTVEIEGGNGM